jgi:hypothetical protein
MGENLHQDLHSKDEGVGEFWRMGARGEVRDIVADPCPKPKSQMSEWGNTRHHLVAQLLGEEGLVLEKKQDTPGHPAPSCNGAPDRPTSPDALARENNQQAATTRRKGRVWARYHRLLKT